MTWRPGIPVTTADDRAAWERWRRERKRQQQRERRAANPRIDYYPAPEALTIIDSLRRPHVGGDVSSVLNRIVGEWAEHCHRKSVSPESRTDGGTPPE